MTGYGTAEADVQGVRLSVEIRSVNHRFLDLTIKMPRSLSTQEGKARALLSDHLSRGKVSVFVTGADNDGAADRLAVNHDVAQAITRELATLKERYSLAGEIELSVVAGFPELWKRERVEWDGEAMWPSLEAVLLQSVRSLQEMRAAEGDRLAADLRDRLSQIESMLGEVESRAPDSVKNSQTRLREKVQKLTDVGQLDEARLATEVALIADRMDITEECVRLRSHISQFRDSVSGPEPAGRRLNFLLQEMGREANTIGSKASDLTISHVVVSVKEELEKMREQVQNIE